MRIVVLGGGESGFGAAVLAKVKGFDVFLSDAGKIEEKYKAQLDGWGVPFEEGGHTESLILNAGEVVKSPGIPDTASIVEAVRGKGIPVISEIELAGRYTRAKTICITGSNGKTTTTTLAYEILKQAGFNVGLAGNIGRSFALQVATSGFDWYVMELSSFQLDGMFDFRADISVLLNITPDHLDRYGYNFQNYVDSKFRITHNQTDCDSFIYCFDDRTIRANISTVPPDVIRLPFSVKERLSPGAWQECGEIVVDTPSGGMRIDTSKLRVKGLHNVCNVMAASLAAVCAGVKEDDILKVLYLFSGVEHRLEFVREKEGVAYVNDSKATNVDSVWYALESMKTPVVWIAGGTDKGNDYAPLAGFARDRVKALVCLGVDNEKLADFFGGIVPKMFEVRSMADAVRVAREVAAPGDTVLLSPACASFDLFKNYEDRGRQFKEEVYKLGL